MSDVLKELTDILEARKGADAQQSYVASLHARGLNKILEKIGEEATEVILAAKDASAGKDTADVISETADLWFHCMVMLSHLDCSAEDVLKVLQQRFDISGLAEKAARSNNQ